MSTESIVGMYRITIREDADTDDFEQTMREKVFPTVQVGQDTRAGTVFRQSLVRRAAPGSENEYAWIVEWSNIGGKRFGSSDRPDDPAPSLESFGAETEFERFELVASEGQALPGD